MGFTRRSMERISEVVRTVEGMRLNDRPSRAGAPVVVVPEIRVVRITSTTLVDDRYPAELLDRDPVTGVWDSFDPVVVVHVEPLDGETLTEGILDCRRSGETDAGISIFTPLRAASTGGSGSLDVEDTSGASIATGVDTLQFGYSTLATLNPFNSIAVADMGGGTVAVTARFATRKNAGVLGHDEYTSGYQEIGGVKAFVHPIVLGPQNPGSLDNTGTPYADVDGGIISFVPLDDPTDYDGAALGGAQAAATTCSLFGSNLGDSSQENGLYAATYAYAGSANDAWAMLRVWSGKPAILSTLRPRVELSAEVIGEGDSTSYQDNRGFHVEDDLSVGGDITLTGGFTGTIDGGTF